MRILFSVVFGLYLLLGNIALVGVHAITELETENMTPAPEGALIMSLAVSPVEASAPSCTDGEKAGACPTDRCFRASDDQSQPEEVLLAHRPLTGTDTSVLSPLALNISFPIADSSASSRHEKTQSTLAFHLSNVVLRE